MDLLLEERSSCYVSENETENKNRSCWHLVLDDWESCPIILTGEALVALWHDVAPSAGKLVCFHVYHGHAVFTVPKGAMTDKVTNAFVAAVKNSIKKKENAHA